MNRFRCPTSFALEFAFFFVALLVLPTSGCDGGPPPTVAPADTPVDKEQFSHAKLTFKDEVVKNDHVILEKGKEYEYSGSFQLAQVDDEAAEYEKFVTYVQGMLGVTIVVDGKKSGYKLPPRENAPPKPVREVITGGGKVQNTRFKSPNLIEFSGRLEAPNHIGEQELRLFFVREDTAEPVNILTRVVQVVEPKAPKGN
jgi:hypothetical protein